MSAQKKPAGKPGVLVRELVVANKFGIHARPAAQFVKISSRFNCEVMVEKDDETVNGKSIMGLMMLAAGNGTKIRVTAEGADAVAALDELETLLKNKFGEE